MGLSKFEFSAENSNVLHLPSFGEWYTLSLNSPLTLQYEESDVEYIYLQIPDGCAGKLEVEQDDQGISFECRLSPGCMCSMRDLVLVISHKGLEQLSVAKNSEVFLRGELGVHHLYLDKASHLTMLEASVVSADLCLSLSGESVCKLGWVETMKMSIYQSNNSRLSALEIYCLKELCMEMSSESYALVGGFAKEMHFLGFGTSRLEARQLEVPSLHCSVTDQSAVFCNSPSVTMYVSRDAHFTNVAPDAEHTWKEREVEFLPLRHVDRADAFQIALHMIPEDSGRPRRIKFFNDRHLSGRSISGRTELHMVTCQGISELRDDRNCPYTIDELKSIVLKFPGSDFYIHVSEKDVDWTKIPDIRRRFMKTVPEMFECFL